MSIGYLSNGMQVTPALQSQLHVRLTLLRAEEVSVIAKQLVAGSNPALGHIDVGSSKAERAVLFRL